jgi:hypothetical protein
MSKIERVDVARNVLDVHRDLSVSARVRKPGPPERIDGMTVGIQTVTQDAPHGGEMHPDGDEILHVISGRVAGPKRVGRPRDAETAAVTYNVFHRLVLCVLGEPSGAAGGLRRQGDRFQAHGETPAFSIAGRMSAASIGTEEVERLSEGTAELTRRGKEAAEHVVEVVLACRRRALRREFHAEQRLGEVDNRALQDGRQQAGPDHRFRNGGL